MDDQLLREARALGPGLEELFEALHREPELGNREEKTAALIRRRLAALGWEAAPVIGTGTVALLRGGRPGPTVGIRADIDALPITEDTGLPYASRVPGVMHACGHDFHTAALLGAAELLARRRESLPGNVKLFFQPDEEGDGGAQRMIAAGCMEAPHVDAVFCCHVDSTLPTGTVSVRPGPICAASNPFSVTLRGRGCHGAKPHLGSDVIVAGAQVVTALQTIASRRTAPTEPVVVTVGAFHSGSAGNVLAETAELTGILRTMGGEARERVKGDFRSIVSGIAAAMGVEADITITESYSGCRNDPAMTALLCRAAGEILGPGQVRQLPEPSLGTDDFGYFSDAAPGCYYFIGVGDREGAYPIHSPHFTADRAALPLAAAVHVRTVLDFLGGDER